MGVFRVQTTIGGELVAIEATGELGDTLSRCEYAVDVLTVFSEIKKAVDQLSLAQAYDVTGYSQDVAWQRAHQMAAGIGIPAGLLDRIKETRVTVISLEPS